ncbi:OLC1v1018684C1 [Oldenlandia corymbosa var. corymbosa]|uniref:OLC1v1018684C1 n=1 Tax=Oldenlandia corymbosa var. corymbosa TaxID=529605 RepID=A0AAV1EC88_OLDCO|nr:OLC1v1018684C1 [Oldenlandia corymbosa var. corymbosa]
MESSLTKLHAVCVPYPVQGHINPMLKLAKILHQKGFHITFVNTEFNHKRLQRSRGPDSVNGFPSFRFESIPDGLPPSDVVVDASQDIPSLSESTSRDCIDPFKELLAKLNQSASSSQVNPPVSCIVSDGAISFTLEAAEEFGICNVLFWATSACAYLAFMHDSKVVEMGITPLKGLEGIHLRDFPSFIRTTNPDDTMIKFFLQETERDKKASAIILNTFEELEFNAIQALSSILPPIYSTGPLNLLQELVDQDGSLSQLGSNLWKEETECFQWLDDKEHKSVVSMNFGSITVMTSDQLLEFARGLANSK